MKKLLTFLSVTLLGGSLFAITAEDCRLKTVISKPKIAYDVGEKAVIRLSLRDAEGRSVRGVPLTVEKYTDRNRKETTEMTSGANAIEIEATSEVPAIVQYWVKARFSDGTSLDSQIGVVFGLDKIVASSKNGAVPESAEIDAYWDSLLAQDDAQFRETPAKIASSFIQNGHTIYDLEADSLGGKVYARVYVPQATIDAQGTRKDSVWCQLHAYGKFGFQTCDWWDQIMADIGAHPYYKDEDINGKVADNYGFNEEENASADTCYFRNMLLRDVRMIRILRGGKVVDADGNVVIDFENCSNGSVTLYGTSQGGFQAAALAGVMGDEISRFEAGCPWLCDLAGAFGDTATVPGTHWRPAYGAGIIYCDPVQLAHRITAGGTITQGLCDNTCPPDGTIALFNAIPNDVNVSLSLHQFIGHALNIDANRDEKLALSRSNGEVTPTFSTNYDDAFYADADFEEPELPITDPDAPFAGRITFDVDGSTLTGAVSNVPVLVRLAYGQPAGFRPENASPEGIRFYDGAGCLLPHEVDTWDPIGESCVWVLMREIKPKGTKLRMYYGGEKASGQPTAEGSVWGEFTGVWHMTDLKDSCANTLDAEPGSNSAPYAAGAIGGAYTVNTAWRESSTITVSLDDLAKKSAVEALGTTFTASLWMRDPTGADWDWLIARKSGGSGWGVRRYGDPYLHTWQLAAGSQWQETEMLKNDPTGNGRWAKVDLIYDGAAYKLYVDGALDKEGTLPQAADNSTAGDMLGFGGTSTSGDFSFRGQMDEIRLAQGARTADWIAAAYASEKTGSAFLSSEKGAEWGGFTPADDVDSEQPGEDPEQPGEDPDDPPVGPVTPEVAGDEALVHAVQFTVSGYAGESTLEGFPVLVRLSANAPQGFTYGEAKAEGLRFFAADGTPLPYDVDTWDPNGTSLVWVRLPQLAGKDTTFTLKYGPNSDKTPKAEGSVWADYAGVWHLTDLKDAGVNGLTATAGVNSAPYAEGAIGGAYTVNTGYRTESTIAVSLADSAKKAAVDAMGTTFTASFWMQSVEGVDWEWIITRKDGAKSAGWGLEQNGDWSSYKGTWRVFAADGWTESEKLGNDPVGASRWAKVDLMYDDATYRLYIDGVLVSSGDLSQTVDNSTATTISFGGCQGDNFSLRGQMDEVRLSAGVRSADWIAAEYANQTSADFVTAGHVQTPVNGMLFTRVATFETAGYTGSTTLTNFPVLVRLSEGHPRRFHYRDCALDGLRFADANGNMIPYEIDTWNVTGESLVWVKVPAVADGKSTFKMYYGGEKAASAPTVDAPVWADYAGVWHLNDTSDASPSGLTLTEKGTCAATSAGALGGAYAFDGGGLTTAIPEAINTALGTEFSASVWYRLKNNYWSRLLTRTWAFNDHWENVWGFSFNGEWKFDGSISATVAGQTKNIENADPFSDFSNPVWVKADLQMCVIEPGTTTCRVYVNGALKEEFTLGAAVQNSGMDLGLGICPKGDMGLYGDLDEVRIRPGTLSADWVKAAYLNESGADFLACERVATAPGGLAGFRVLVR